MPARFFAVLGCEPMLSKAGLAAPHRHRFYWLTATAATNSWSAGKQPMLSTCGSRLGLAGIQRLLHASESKLTSLFKC